MNCKKGDLAVIVQSNCAPQHIGKIVSCVRLLNIENIQYWEIEKTLENPGGIPYWCVADQRLRPIRDPGDDAQDESLQWLPVPSTEKEAT